MIRRETFDAIVKSQGNAILLFEMGDFYEMFFGHAEMASKYLGLTLVSRSRTEDIPMVGFPRHQLDGYIAKLVQAGFKVSVVDESDWKAWLQSTKN